MRIRFPRVVLIFGGFLPSVEAAAASSGFARAPDGAGGWMAVAGGLVSVALAAAWWRERRRHERTESQLRSVNERMRVLFDESPLSICVFDPHDREIPFRIVECNQAACDLHGQTRDELIGRSMGVLTTVNVTYEGAQAFMVRLRNGPQRGENPHRRKDGTVFNIEYVARRVVIDGHEYLIGVDRDLTSEKARRESEELNRLVLRASNDGIWDWRVTEKRTTYSDRCREMLGYTAEELPDGSPAWTELIHPEDWATNASVLRRHWEEGEPYAFQFRARHKDGNWRWLVSRGTTLFDENKRPVRMVGCRTDITEIKRMDAELLQSRKLRAVGEMVGGIAHEFNNLLTPMLLHADMLALETGGNRVAASHIGPIRAGIDRARELTQRILTFGRRSVDACEFLELGDVVRDNIAFLGQTIERQIHIAFTASPTPTVVWANRSDMNQLVINLVLNARDTLREKAAQTKDEKWVPRLELTTTSVTRGSGARDEPDPHTPRAWHRLTVHDNGLGIGEEVRDRVFEPFFTTKEVGRGTGLGLATAWHVAMSVGGWIDIESKAGEGSTFHVYLPAATGSAERPAPKATTGAPMEVAHTASPETEIPAKAKPAATEEKRGWRVLLVEDSELVAFATQKMIESFGHEVKLLTDGAAAWAELSREAGRYDMVFTDLNLPGMSGVELVRRLREAGGGNRVVVYSGYFSAEHEEVLKTLNVDRLLQKPFTRAQLGPVLK